MTSETWLKIIAVLVGVPLIVAIPALIILGFSYRVTERHLVVQWLRIPVRRVRLEKIRSVGTTPVWWAERWPCALNWRGRYLVVRKNGWIFNNMVITPKNPFVFRAELYRARDALLPPADTAPEAQPEQKSA